MTEYLLYAAIVGAISAISAVIIAFIRAVRDVFIVYLLTAKPPLGHQSAYSSSKFSLDSMVKPPSLPKSVGSFFSKRESSQSSSDEKVA